MIFLMGQHICHMHYAYEMSICSLNGHISCKLILVAKACVFGGWLSRACGGERGFLGQVPPRLQSSDM